MQPPFSNKGTDNANIKLTEKDEIVENNGKLGETLNDFLRKCRLQFKIKGKFICYQ